MPLTTVSLSTSAVPGPSSPVVINWRGGRPVAFQVTTNSSLATGDFVVQATLDDVQLSLNSSALSVKLDDPVPLQEMTPNHWAFADARFDMPTHWREWLGTIRTEEVEHSNLFLLSKMLSQVPEVVDAETAELKRHAGHFYAGLLLASPFAPAHKAGHACRIPPTWRNQRPLAG